MLALYLGVTALTFAMRAPSRVWLSALPLALADCAIRNGVDRERRAHGPRLRDVIVLYRHAAAGFGRDALPVSAARFSAGTGRGGISIFDAAPSAVALACALIVNVVGIVVVGIYSSIVWRAMAGKVRVE